ncbi:MAG: hypothetical protein ACPGU1_21445, partial [Myxococcota bacterium]
MKHVIVGLTLATLFGGCGGELVDPVTGGDIASPADVESSEDVGQGVTEDVSEIPECEPACADGEVCLDGACSPEPAPCEPVCASDGACGDDGCGGSCGACADGSSCGDDGVCAVDCSPTCADEGACGDDGCGGSCGACADG